MAAIEKDASAPFDNGPLEPDGQYRDYAVLPKSERDKGFIRPVRSSYMHVGAPSFKYLLRDLTSEEAERYKHMNYVKFEAYPESESPVLGRYWTQEQLANMGKGCKAVTTMGPALAETYARNPKYYGSTFCAGCHKHLPVEEFVWSGSTERVGS